MRSGVFLSTPRRPHRAFGVTGANLPKKHRSTAITSAGLLFEVLLTHRPSPSPKSSRPPSKFGSTNSPPMGTAHRWLAGPLRRLSSPRSRRASPPTERCFDSVWHCRPSQARDAHTACMPLSCVSRKVYPTMRDRGKAIPQGTTMSSCMAPSAVYSHVFGGCSPIAPFPRGRGSSGVWSRALSRSPPSTLLSHAPPPALSWTPHPERPPLRSRIARPTPTGQLPCLTQRPSSP